MRSKFAVISLTSMAIVFGVRCQARAQETVGHPLIGRAYVDGASGSIFLLGDGFTAPGAIADWGLYQEVPQFQVTPLIFEADGAGGFTITGIGTTRTATNAGVQTFAFDLVAGSAQVGPGSLFGWKDGSIGGDNTGIPEWSDGGPAVDWLGGGHTEFGVGENFAVAAALNRTYSLEAETVDAGGGSVETIGNPLVDAPKLDTAGGSLFVMSGNPFTADGLVDQWSFFNDSIVPPSPNSITPLVLEQVGDEFMIRGIGQTRTPEGSGEHRFAFDLVDGSDRVDAGFFFGWKDGGIGADNAGVARYDDQTADSVTWFGGEHTAFGVGDNLGAGTSALQRTYSIEATAIPEPSSMALAGLAMVGSLVYACRSRKRKQ